MVEEERSDVGGMGGRGGGVRVEWVNLQGDSLWLVKSVALYRLFDFGALGGMLPFVAFRRDSGGGGGGGCCGRRLGHGGVCLSRSWCGAVIRRRKF